MPSGHRIVAAPVPEVRERLRFLLAASNCRTREQSDNSLRFTHGTYLTQSAPLFLKECTLTLREVDGSTEIGYEIHVARPIAIYLTFFAVVLCWTVLMPFLVHRTLVVHPRLFIENLLAGL